MQNIYDDPTFFEGYSRLRERAVNANNLFEIPAMMSLLPELAGKRMLDLGCGTGERCAEYARRGASRVVGIDISEKMLAVARQKNADPRVEYRRLPIERVCELDSPFDLAVSSLALQYVEDFAGVVAAVYDLLTPGGRFVFSQESPINTCFTTGERWTKDAAGNKLYANLSNYSVDGVRESTWFVDGVKKYHRTFSSVINALADAGFVVERLLEPFPDEAMAREYPDYADLLHKPDFLLVRARKP